MAWVRDVYSRAIIDGLRDIFGLFPAEASGQQVEGPEEKPSSVFVKPIERPWVKQLREGASSVRLPDTNHPQGFVTWFAVDRMYRAKKDVARQQVATDTSEFINEPVPAGVAIMIDAVETNYKGDAYGLSPWGTMFRLDDLEPLPWPEMPDLRSSLDERSDGTPGARLMDGLQAASDELREPERVPDHAIGR